MVSFGRKGEEATDNPLAKLLQATQDVMDKESPTDTSVTSETNPNLNNKVSDESEHHLNVKSKKHLASALASVGSINAIPSPYPPPPVAFMSGPLVAQAAMLSAHPLYGPEPEEESCGRPFCKLKRRPHYHCNLCNQGFTEKDKLETHLKRHTEPPQNNAVSGATPSLASLLAAAKESGIPNLTHNLLNPTERESSNSISNLLASTEQALKQQQAMLAAATASEKRRNSSPNRGGGSPLTSSIANLSVMNQRPLSPSSRSGHSVSPAPSLGGNSVVAINNGTLSTPTSSSSTSVSSSNNIGKSSESPRPPSTESGTSSIFPNNTIPTSISNSMAAAAVASMYPALGATFSAGSPFNLRHPVFTTAGGINISAATASGNNAAAGILLPPGLNPFFPPGFLQLPGIPGHNPFQQMLPGAAGDISRLPTSTVVPGVSGMVFDPTKHPLTRQPGDPSLGGSLKRSATSPMSSILMDDDSLLTPEEKKFKLQSSMRMLKDEPVPEGYMRFR